MHYIEELTLAQKKALAKKCLAMFEGDLDNERALKALIFAARDSFGVKAFIPQIETTLEHIGVVDLRLLREAGFNIEEDEHELAYLTKRGLGTREAFEELLALDKSLAFRTLNLLRKHNGMYLPLYMMYKNQLEKNL